ncbi:MAG: LytTR family transcriptional regulator [Gammaproteobacteria bacterium]|nr:LytTR family transcriptional regulator [Gammaproteobacteria bacterium]
MASQPTDAIFAASAIRPDRSGAVRQAWGPLLLYVGIPLALCLYLSFNNWQLLDALGFWSTLGFYAAHAAVPWAVTALLTWGLYRALARWTPGLGVVTTLGSLLACVLVVPYTAWLMSAWGGGAAAEVLRTQAALGWSWGGLAAYAARATLLWVGVNFLFDRFLGYPRYRYAGQPDPRTAQVTLSLPASTVAAIDSRQTPHPPGSPEAQALPGFMERLKKPASLDMLLAIRAEQHYLRVITQAGSELVLYRLSDALRELPPDLGVQVHRSWWVRASAIETVEGQGKKVALVLSSGERVPVSAPYQALVRSIVDR